MKVSTLIVALACSLAISILGLLAPPEAAASREPKADRVVVLKEARKLYLMRDGDVIDSFRIALGRNPVGPKVFQGDGRTPEGTYVLTYKNENSRFHRSIRISYPNPENQALARRFGISPGGDIMIHGQPNGWRGHVKQTKTGNPPVRGGDWTEGCIAVSNAEMDRIWSKVDPGTPIEIRP